MIRDNILVSTFVRYYMSFSFIKFLLRYTSVFDVTGISEKNNFFSQVE